MSSKARAIDVRLVGAPTEGALEAFARLLLLRQQARPALVVVDGKKPG